MTNLCLALKYDKPDDPQPMVCTRQLDHDGDHQPTGYRDGAWATWSDEEAAS